MSVNDEQHERRVYTTAISKGAGMIDETRRLLAAWNPHESLDDFARRVQAEGLLGNSTAYRTRDIVRRVFALRLLRPDDHPARLLKAVLASGLSGRVFTELFFIFAARQDPLVYDFTVREYWPAVRRTRTVMDTELVLSFLSEAQLDGRLDNEWSHNVAVRIARCVLGLLRDVGFLRETTRGRREIVDYRVTDEAVVLLARELHDSGVTDASLAEHQDWELFGLREPEIVQRLDSIGEQRGLLVQQAGSVVHYTWGVGSLEELIDVLA